MAEHGCALLGGGLFAKNWHLPALAETPTLTLKAIYSRSSSSAVSIATAALQFPSTSHPISLFYDVASEGVSVSNHGGDLEALLKREDVKTVILSLPIPIQPDVIKRCFAAGKNVISEKPVAQDKALAKELIELWEKDYKPKGATWIIAEQFPYEPSLVKARELISKIGTLRSFTLEHYLHIVAGTPSVSTAWRAKPTHQGGFVLDGGVHWVAGLREVLPVAITSITATREQYQPYLSPCDTLHGLVKTSSGVTGTVVISFGQEGPTYRNYIFRGSAGKLTVDLSTTDNVVKLSLFGAEEVVIPLEGRAVKEEFLAFGAALVAGVDSEKAKDVQRRSGPRAALKDLEVIEAALESGETGLWVDLHE